MINRILEICEGKAHNYILSKIFPPSIRDTNDWYYGYALELLIRLEENGIRSVYLPLWHSQDVEVDISKAIKILINLCLTHFQEHLDSKIVLLAENTFRRIFKMFAVIDTNQIECAEIIHLLTRYYCSEFSWGQILSSPERNVLIHLDLFSFLKTKGFVDNFIENHRVFPFYKKFKTQLAKQYLENLWNWQAKMLRNKPNYFELCRENNLREIHPTEKAGIVYDNLGHNALIIINRHEKWKNYILDKHLEDVGLLAKMGSWIAVELIGKNKDIYLTSEVPRKLLVDRFFLGNENIFEEIISAYGLDNWGLINSTLVH